MTTTTPTTSNQPPPETTVYDDVFRGVLLEAPESNNGDQKQIVLAIPTTDYRLHLVLSEVDHLDTPIGQAVPGHINVQANRVDVCNTGGQFIDPVMGRPRTIQGRVRTIDHVANQLVIQAKIPIRAQLRAPQNAADFKPGDLVRFMVDRGATFAPLN